MWNRPVCNCNKGNRSQACIFPLFPCITSFCDLRWASSTSSSSLWSVHSPIWIFNKLLVPITHVAALSRNPHYQISQLSPLEGALHTGPGGQCAASNLDVRASGGSSTSISLRWIQPTAFNTRTESCTKSRVFLPQEQVLPLCAHVRALCSKKVPPF